MEFALLGPLLVSGDEGPVSIGGAQQRAVLALLVLEPNRVVPRDRLIDGLWGDDPPETATQTVQVYISRLRKLLPAGMLVTRSPGYALELDPNSIDVHRFATLVDEARSLPPAHAAQRLRDALDLWRGPALAEFAHEPALRVESARLEEARLGALEQRLDADLQLGRHAQLIGELETLVSRHPYRERLIAQLMLALYRAGRQAEALATYRQARATLADQLGLEPGQSLQALEHAILRHDPSLDLSPATEPVESSDDATPLPVPALKVVTVVFCEPLISSKAGERTDPETLHLVTSRYLEAVRVVMQRHGGLVERGLTDACACVFGLPVVHEDDASRALRAAVELRTAIGELDHALQRDLRTTLDVRIGLATGEVITGSDAWPATGHVVGAAARLQQGAAAGEIVIAAETLALVRRSVRVEEVRPSAYRVTEFEPWAPRARRRFNAPMVGRNRELERLAHAFAHAVDAPGCALCTLVGAAGVGKSRLAREFVAGIDACVVEGRCLPYGEGITYAAAVDVVGQLGEAHHELLTALPAAAATIAALLGETETATIPEEIAWSMRKLFEAAARDRPLVVVLDDVQWGEAVFLDLVEHVAYLSTGAPIMLLCLARPELLDRRPGWGGTSGSSTIVVEPLLPREVDELIDHLLRGEELDHELGTRVRAAAQGNPLFVEEMLAMVQDAGGGTVLVPPTITALLAARLDQLDPAERALLGYGSIEGELFHRSAVEVLAPPGHSVERTLVALVRKDLVRPDRSPILRDDAYRFRHLLLRDAAYDALPKATRAELHERFADWLSDNGDQVAERDELIGYHLEQAYRFRAELGSPGAALGERAADHLGAAARRARALSDFEAVAGLLRRALALGISNPNRRLRAQFELGNALHQTRRTDEAEAILAETHDHAAQLGEDGIAAVTLVQRMWNRTGETTMDYGEAEVVAGQAIDVLTRVGDDRGLALARRLRAIAVASREGPTPAVGAELERAFAHAVASGDNEMLRLAIGSLANRYLVSGETPAEAAIGRCEQLLDSVHGDRVLEATVKRPLGLFYAMATRPADAGATLDDAAAVLDELDLRSAEVYRWVVAYARELAGDLKGAEQELQRMFRYFRDLRGARVDTRASAATVELARIYCDEQRWDDAAEALAYDPDYVGGSRAIGTTDAAAVRARLASRAGLAEALSLAERAVACAETRASEISRRAHSHLALSEVQRSSGRPSEADDSLATAIALFERKGNIAEARAAARRFARVAV